MATKKKEKKKKKSLGNVRKATYLLPREEFFCRWYFSCKEQAAMSLLLFFKFYLFIRLAILGLCCCTGFSLVGERERTNL